MASHAWFQASIPLLIAFAIVVATTPVMILAARRFGWVAAPRPDRWHSRPTALMGGVAIVAGCVASWLVFGDWHSTSHLLLPAVGIFLLGLVDDRIRLSPHIKLIGQLVAAGVLALTGVRFGAMPAAASFPLTFLWVVGITNAVNLLDNMDGLAAGVSAISALTLSAYCISEGAAGVVPIAMGLVGACLGFLVYNFSPAKIFMGDCGSMFIGFTLASLSIAGTNRSAPNLLISLLVPVAVLAVPIFDTTLVSVARTLNGRAISQGGRDHSSHRLFALGLSERGTVAVLYLLTALFGSLAVLATQVRLSVVLLLAVLLFTSLIVLGLYLGVLQVYSEEARIPDRFRRLGGTWMYKKKMLQVLLDAQLVVVAFVGAHLLRFDGALDPSIMRGLTEAIPIILATKLVGMAICRAYRGVWRYAGMGDVVQAIAGSLVGSLLTTGILAMATGLHGVSRSALIIDWLLFTLLAVAARTWYVMLRHVFGMLPPRTGPRVVIIGADSRGVALAHRLRDPHAPVRAEVLGILDDDPDKQGRALDGVSVLGPVSDLPALVEQRGVSYCLVSGAMLSESAPGIVSFCEQRHVRILTDTEIDFSSLSSELALQGR